MRYQCAINTLAVRYTFMPAYDQRMPNVCLAYKPYVGIRTKFLSMLKNNFLPRRMPAYATVLETYTTYA